MWSIWRHCHHIVFASLKSGMVSLPFWYQFTQVVLEKMPLNECCFSTAVNELLKISDLTLLIE